MASSNLFVGRVGRNRRNDGAHRRGNPVPEHRRRESDHQKLLRGFEGMTRAFDKQMGTMAAKMADMERKQDLNMQQNEAMIQYIQDREEAESKWKSLAEERLKKYSDALNEVAELMKSKTGLERANERWKRANMTAKKKLEKAVDENESIRKKVSLLLDENRQLRDDIFQVAEALGGDGTVLSLVAEDCGFEAEGDWDEKKIKDKQMARNTAVATIVMCYVRDMDKK